ncbi:MAG TPA: Type 1 glutamine amidotransferase-like domain-containing protein [Mycobacteriales bacterium]|nr:Type 1 glutamine amidotransferase-like domain-containing protein [Mycobacteriales bacterium]
MTGLVCLQGGGEFSPGCRPMDTRVVRRAAGGPQPVRTVVCALAAAPGTEHDTAVRNGVAHYRRLGADAVGAPDARTDAAGAVRSLRAAGLVVLPGGSPSRLLGALRETPVGALLGELLADGVALSGSSAGAMVLGGWTVLPERRGAHGLAVEPALGLVPGVVVVPHWSGGGSRGDWLRAVTSTVPDATVIGLPEESGVLVEGRQLLALGQTASCVVASGVELPPGAGWTLPHPR